MIDKKQENTIFKKIDALIYHEKPIILQSNEQEQFLNYFKKKKGWLYIMKNDDHDFLKIGRTTKTPLARAKSLSNTGVLTDYEVVFSQPSFNQVITEKELFVLLKKYRVQGEFFSCNLQHAIDSMNKVIMNEEKRLSKHFDIDLLKTDINLINSAILAMHN